MEASPQHDRVAPPTWPQHDHDRLVNKAKLEEASPEIKAKLEAEIEKLQAWLNVLEADVSTCPA